MLRKVTLAATVASFAVLSALPVQANESHAHIGHVMTKWKDTPDQKGFLPVAIEEAKVAETHAGLAASDQSDLSSMQLHSRHVLHALDPSVETSGPGAGFGVLKATEGTHSHIGFAAGSDGASDAVKLHATHVSAAAEAVLKRTEEVKTLIAGILAAPDDKTAAPMVEKMKASVSAITIGEDLNGDGSIGWADGEGGLAVAKTHMGFMMDAEGLQ
ncbi:hypothetical protein [Pelagibius sp. Alg239-R121]|uniref:hypothetical protein n=1 Tax=Pelagibius sp. Alg239-R121 TaxID=2993448 RepID=UPI0024A69071|nr:hypothetical protein [Pelagibius sp. Alg239-R121]